MQRGRIFLGSTCVCPSSETRRKRDHTEGDEGREVSGALLFMVSDLFQGLSLRRRCERASEADNERDVFSFFERERGTTEGSWRTQTSNTHQSTVYNKTQNKQEISSKSLTFTWKTPKGVSKKAIEKHGLFIFFYIVRVRVYGL